MKTARSSHIAVSKTFKGLVIFLLVIVGAATTLPVWLARGLPLLDRGLLLLPAFLAGGLCVLVARMGTRTTTASALVATQRPSSQGPLAATLAARTTLSVQDLHYKKLGRIALAVFLMSSILLALCVVLYLRGDRYLDVPAFLLGSLALVAGLSAVAPRALLEPRYEPTPETEDSGWYMSMDGGITISPMAGEGGLPIEM